MRGRIPTFREFAGTLARTLIAGLCVACAVRAQAGGERQLTFDSWNHDLDNNDNFSPDDQWILYDHRDDALGVAATASISKVNIVTGRTEVVYAHADNRRWGPGVAAASFNPRDGSVVVMSGLDDATETRPYELWRRTCALVKDSRTLARLDARDVTAPFTPGALRGGSHRPEWSADGEWIGFTYDDEVLVESGRRAGKTISLRTVGVASYHGGPVRVNAAEGNASGLMFSVVVVRVTPNPKPGSDEIKKAFEDSWVGRNGYRHPDGHWQTRARAFLGTLVDRDGREFTEVFVVDIPDRLNKPAAGEYLEGTLETMPSPPEGTRQRRLTFTGDRKHPGVSLLPRHWLRSSPDGSEIAYLAKDDAGVIQVFLVSPETGRTRQITEHRSSIQSCVRWSPDGRHLLYVCDNSVMICDTAPDVPWEKRARALTAPTARPPESPVWSNDGRLIAFNRRVAGRGGSWKQIFLINGIHHAAEKRP